MSSMSLTRRSFGKAGLAGIAAAGMARTLDAPASADVPRPSAPMADVRARNAVLVHGLYADGSSWIDVVPHLEDAGLPWPSCRTR